MFPQSPFAINVESAEKFLARAKSGGTEESGDLKFFPVSGAVSEEEEVLHRFLSGVQGNVLHAHGRTFVTLLFFRFKRTGSVGLASNQAFLVRAGDTVISALDQHVDARRRKRNRGNRPFVGIQFTVAGIAAVGRPMPQEPRGVDSFAQGMLARHELLGDPSRAGRPSTWQDIYRREGEVHGMWLVGHRTKEGLAAECRRVVKEGKDWVDIVHREHGVNMRDREGFAREPFGFRDGLSMPKFFKPAKQTGGLINMPLDRLLIESEGLDSGGSFMVYRKLEQDVAAFRRFEKTLAPYLRNAGLSTRDPGRLLIGRLRDGTPLVAGAPRPTRSGNIGNTFSFPGDDEAPRCPFHAHVRKANFRQADGEVSLPIQAQLGAQFVRRGVVFGRGPRWNPRVVKPAKCGLLFMAYMANISGQFETVQATWMGGDEFPTRNTSQKDPLMPVSATSESQGWQWPQRCIGPLGLPNLVTPRGGAYLFVPPLQWLNPALAGPGAMVGQW